MGHPLIPADRVNGTDVYNAAGDKLGKIEDIAIDKVSGQVAYAILSFGGFLGLDERYHPMPWSLLRYDVDKGGYVVPLDKAQLEGAMRDQRRYSELVEKSATPVINLDNAKTQVGIYTAAFKADEGTIENLKVQLTYATIRAPITGRISMAAVKVGNFVRQADTAPMATINRSMSLMKMNGTMMPPTP